MPAATGTRFDAFTFRVEASKIEELCFALKSREAFGIAQERIGEHFDSDVAFQAAVVRTIDLTHSPGADGCHDFVGTKTCAWSERHVRGAGII